jgi:hypothetical protein
MHLISFNRGAAELIRLVPTVGVCVRVCVCVCVCMCAFAREGCGRREARVPDAFKETKIVNIRKHAHVDADVYVCMHVQA